MINGNFCGLFFSRLCIFLTLFFLLLLPFAPSQASVADCPAACRCMGGQSLDLYPEATRRPSTNVSVPVVVNCSDSDLTAWPRAFPGGVVGIFLDSNKLKVLENVSTTPNASDYSLVMVLSFENNLLTHIESGAFAAFESLRALRLAHNRLSGLAWSASLASSRLVEMDLSYNSIERVSPSSLEPLKVLERLDLSHNYITVVERRSFVGFGSLRLLDLSSNMISVGGLQQDSLSRLDALTILSLAENRPMNRVPDFVEVGLEDNALRSLDMHGLPYLTHVDSFAFQKFGALRELNLSFCAIQHLEQGWLNGGPHRTLETLDLSHNLLRAVDEYSFVAISANQKLTDPNTYSTLPLDAASLSYVVSPSVGESVQQVSAFTSHSLNSPSLGAEWYRPLERLAWLSLRSNVHLTKLSDSAFSYTPNLQYLFLQNCNITSLNIAAPAYRFRTTAIRQTLPSIRAMWLYNNPAMCDCYVREIRYEIDGASEDNFAAWCESNPDNSTSQQMQLDPSEYYYSGECVRVAAQRSSACYSPQDGQWHLLVSVPMAYLRCPDEPMSLLIVMLIGPAIFAVAIFVVMVCGMCSVFVRRARRYRAGKYHLMDEKMALTARDRISKSNGRERSHRYANIDYSPSLTNRDSPLPERASYGTNLVLGGMNSRLVSGDPAISFHVPSFLQPGARRPRSRSPSPTTKKKLEDSRRQHPDTNGGSRNELYHETSLSVKVDTASSRSCPNVSTVDPRPVEFWKHPRAGRIADRGRNVTTSADVNDATRRLLSSTGSVSAEELHAARQDELDDYERVVDSLLHLPT